jgi:hypothetical protein
LVVTQPGHKPQAGALILTNQLLSARQLTCAKRGTSLLLEILADDRLKMFSIGSASNCKAKLRPKDKSLDKKHLRKLRFQRKVFYAEASGSFDSGARQNYATFQLHQASKRRRISRLLRPDYLPQV